MSSPLYAFDLDGTITTTEILPAIAHELGLFDELNLLTTLTLQGVIDFETSFRLRFAILRQVPVDVVRDIVAAVPLNPEVCAFIREHREQCVIVTGNLDRWVAPLVHTIGCPALVSRSAERNGQLVLEAVLHKGQAVRDLAAAHGRVVAVGESVNDIPMFEAADVGIAYGGVHAPAPALLRVADHVTHDSHSLCALLRTLRHPVN